MEEEEKDWFRLKKYPHIGRPLHINDKGWVKKYVTNPNNIKSHAFYPFIHRKITVRKFRRKRLEDGTKTKLRISDKKKREVFYACHLDSCLYSYYSKILNDKYEEFLVGKKIYDAVTAYRRIKLFNTANSRNKCNVDFANDVFNYIASNKNRNLVTITFDISSFFDNLDHTILKDNWSKVLGVKKLPDDHYAIFKNLTKFSYVELEDIFDEFKNEIILKNKSGSIVKGTVPKIGLMKEKGAIAFCEKEDFDRRIRKKKLIKNNKHSLVNGAKTLRKVGIPQGSPISAILANIYMIDFDAKMTDYVENINGIYRRYSDDMVVIADEDNLKNIIDVFCNEIKKVKLTIQESKTQVYLFKYFDNIYGCREYDIISKTTNSSSSFSYLGFTFDGNNVLLKCSGLAKFYRKMKRSIKRGGFYAKYGKNQVPKLFKNRLYKRFTHLGANRRNIYKRNPINPEIWVKTKKYDWGNFITYANLAISTFKENKIEGQLKKSWRIFHELIENKEADIEQYHLKKKMKN